MAVRITQNVTNRSYLTNLTNTQYSMNKTMDKVETGRAFTKVSEDVSAGVKALSIRSRMYKNDHVTSNVEIANEQLKVAEDNLLAVNDILSSIGSEALKVMNGTNMPQGKEIYKSVLESSKDSILKLANGKYNDKYVMGGTNISTQPFTHDDEGHMLFNGIRVSEIEKNNGIYESGGDPVPYSGESYIDIGLDIKVVNGVVDPRTAYRVSVSGLNSLGHGTSQIDYETIDGTKKTYEFSNNVYDIITEMSDAIENEDIDKVGALYDHLNKRMDVLTTDISDIGMRSKFLETTVSRLENENMSLNQLQTDTEGIDDATEIMNYMSYRNAWNLTLQFGNSIIPKTLMDYVT